jgi:hypothetical protein
VSPAEVERLIARLESEDFGVRERAAALLEREGDAAVGALEAALGRSQDLETRLRLERLVERYWARGTLPELVGPLRAIELLEWVGTAEARRILAELAEGRPDSALTREAKGALARLARKR